MIFFRETLSQEELRAAFRRLALMYHPDVGGNLRDMQKINEEYKTLSESFRNPSQSLRDIRIGHTVYVNQSKCVVTAIEKDVFRAKSLETKREAYFSKSTGFAMLNYKFRASLTIC